MTTDTTTAPASQKLTLPTMTAMVIGGMVGAGVFSLPRRFATETGVAGALIAWSIAGAGMLMLAFVFQMLALRKPELEAGVYAYAKAGWGEYLGFFSAFGYWASACVGNVTYWVLIMSTLGAVTPAMGDGDTLVAMLASTAGVWVFYLLIRRGVKGAAAINRVVTIAKMLPILVFILLALFAVDWSVLADNWSGGPGYDSLFDQVRDTMLVTVFVFLGVEGASVYSRHAERREDVGRATILGFVSVFCVFASVTIVSYGILPAAEIAELRQPSMAGVLEEAVGQWGQVLVSIGLVVSVLGAYLAWTLMSSEVLFVAAQARDMPRFLAKVDDNDVPTASLLMTTALIQVMLVVTLFSDDAFNFALDLTSALTLIPFLLAAGYALKLVITRETYEDQPHGWTRELVISALATAYTMFLLFAAGPRFLLVSFVIYAPATILFVMARREQGRTLFSPRELVVLGVSITGAVIGVVALAAGWITI
ncbi:basic amino acid/polyamine antiporter [Nocardioides bizhenqiangii]|uniref:Basic amino acid/polyamine antiporter n=1 Tax=Nocardioides bizhenqiangii TaxID=3095076 RepID=A0ABZ0ZPU0_9ACTN|nr:MULTISPECIES: basic amino acid/polyamine antiporter [unclassified Nocardioides]MDZ5619894.1 basic amino acid/polyamine antiporter [Nocardioides sp. HM23]WQQ26100.1 basic amino acid/polyamine antiporter [Nocardioides sp. HM61]